jgi:hypothetical protein
MANLLCGVSVSSESSEVGVVWRKDHHLAQLLLFQVGAVSGSELLPLSAQNLVSTPFLACGVAVVGALCSIGPDSA